MKRIPEKTLKTVRCGYLYHNGRLVLVHEEKHAKAGRVEWVTVHQTDIRCNFPGRLILSHGAIRLAILATGIEAKEPDISHGSDNTKARAIKVGYVSLLVGPRQYDDRAYIPMIDGLSGDWQLQPHNAWLEPESPYRWGGMPVVDGFPKSEPSAEA